MGKPCPTCESKMRPAGQCPTCGFDSDAARALFTSAPLESVEARYRDLLQRLGVMGHDGAVAEIEALRTRSATESISIPRAQLAKWESWARVRGNEVSPEAKRPSFVSDGLADEMKAALNATVGPGATND